MKIHLFLFSTLFFIFSLSITQTNIVRESFLQFASQQMEKKQFDQGDLDRALDQFDNENLNLTGEQAKPEIDDDPQMAAKIKQEYEKFMNEMKNFGMTGNDDEGFDNLTSMLGGLLKNLASETGIQGDSNQINKGFQQMFKNLKQDNLQQAAGKLLNQFMDKGLLYEPLVEARENYDEYFKKQEGVIGKEDEVRFRKQYEILNEIIGILDNSPEKKDKLIELFEKMQELGSPPEGIASTASFM